MSWISWVCIGVCFGIIISCLRPTSDFLSPARVFGFIWSFSIGLADLKLSRFQHVWNFDSWILLLLAIAAFLLGTFMAYILNIRTELLPIGSMRQLLMKEKVNERRLFWLICLSVIVYSAAYIINYSIRGWLPIFTIGTELTRVAYNVSGLTLFLYTISFIVFFTLIYFLLVEGRRKEKNILITLCVVSVISNLLLLSRYQFIMVFVICFSLLYYSTHHIRLKTILYFVFLSSGFFYWISSIRVSRYMANFIYMVSKMRFSIDYAFLTEPYMYFVMNLENFARSVSLLDYHTGGYFTFDFITAITGLKYWVVEYFNLDRMPYLISGYNTYTAFWWFYSDFGVIGLALIPWILGFSTGLLYYRMRSKPSIKNVTAYGVMVFTMVISYFNFPFSFLWVEYNLLAMYWFLRWTIIPRKNNPQLRFSQELSGI